MSERRRPRGGTPRPAGLGEAGRPHMEASQAEVCVEVKRNEITCFQLTLPAVTARTDLRKAIKGGTIHHFNTHTIGALLFHLYFLE